MARKLRIEAEEAVYHVIVRGNYRAEGELRGHYDKFAIGGRMV